MKAIKTYTLLLFTIFFITACSRNETIKASQGISAKTYDIKNISKLHVATDFKAYVTFSETEESIKIEANDNLFPKIEVSKKFGNKLSVLLKNVNVRGNPTLNLYITTKNIDYFKASSDAKIYLLDELKTDNVEVVLSSDARFKGMLNIDNLSVKASSDAYMECNGKVNHFEMDLSSDANIEAYNFDVEHLNAELSSDATARVTVLKTISVKASSDSKLYYKGDAKIVKQQLSSNAKIIKK